MYHRFFVSLFCLAGLATALAQPDEREREPEKATNGQSAVRYNQVQRLSLRKTLQAQRAQGAAAEQGGRGDRQLNAHERDELRQQLRQQKWDGDRK